MTTTSSESVLENWVETLYQKGKSDHTIHAYQRALAHFTAWYKQAYNGPFDANLVMSRDVRNWKSYQQSTQKAAPASINQRMVALNRFFAWAVHEKWCRDNPTNGVGLIRLETREPKGLKTTDLRRLLRAAKDNLRDYAILEMLVGTGLRVGELLALQVSDVKISERSGSVIVRQGKHDNYREIPLTRDVRKALQDYLEQEHPEPTNPEALLWIGRKGSLTQRSSVKRLLEKYAHLANVAAPSPHALRHTFATRYLTANPHDLRGLARLLGHSNLNTVMIYTEPDMESLTNRMERVEVLPE